MLTAEAIQPNTEAYDTYVSADPVKGKVILGVYEIMLTGTLNGEAQLTFQIPEGYDGRKALVLHYTGTDSYETLYGTIEGNTVTITVNDFSPFVIALEDENAVGAPKTGDSSNAVVWAVLLGISGYLGIWMMRRRRIS